MENYYRAFQILAALMLALALGIAIVPGQVAAGLQTLVLLGLMGWTARLWLWVYR